MDQISISQATAKHNTRFILKETLTKASDSSEVTFALFGTTLAQSVHFWDRLDDGKTARAVFKTIAQALGWSVYYPRTPILIR